MLKDLSSLTLRLFGGKRIYTTKMVNENSEHSILEYLQKNGAVNTFKLAHVLGIKRDKLLGILKNLEEQELVKIVTGKVEFLSYPLSKEKKKQKPKVVTQKEKSEVQVPKKELEKQKLYIEKLKAQIKKLEQKPQKEPLVEKVKAEEIKPKPKRKKKIKIKETKPKPELIKIKKKPIKIRSKKKKIKLTKKKGLFTKLRELTKSKKIKLPKIKKSSKRLLTKVKKPKFNIKNSLKFFKIKKFVKYLKRK